MHDAHGGVRVSVCMKAFNHAPYIAQAVESVLAQRTTFPFELIVGDDVSTDNTRAILRELQARHPDRLRLVLPERNLGGAGKGLYAATLEVARGAYIATMDGDDYWNSADKLQRQVDLLDAHPEYSMCFTDVVEQIEDGSRPAKRLGDDMPKPVTGMAWVMKGCFIGACSPMLRREVVCPLPSWYFQIDSLVSDWTIYILAAEQGDIGYIDEIMGVYRIHPRGMWSRMDAAQQHEAVLEFYTQLHKATRGRFRGRARAEEATWYYRLAVVYQREGHHAEARRAAWQGFRRKPIGRDVYRTLLLKEFVFPYYAWLRSRLGRHA